MSAMSAGGESHRVVTGHDAAGKAIVTSNGRPPVVIELAAAPGVVFHEIWNTAGSPAPIDSHDDPTPGPLTLTPPAGGTRVRFVDFPPEGAQAQAIDARRVHDAFSQIGDAGASTVKSDSPHPMMHRTETVDYGVVIEGAITLVLDDSQVELAQGSVVVQRGTNHAWANRSGARCRMMFVLIDGRYDAAVANALGTH